MKREIKTIYEFDIDDLTDMVLKELQYQQPHGDILSINPIMEAEEPPAGVSDLGSPILNFVGIKVVTTR